MVTLTKYGAKYNRNILFLEGLSTDTKPTGEFDGLSIQNGSEYTEVDTGKKFLFDYDNATWYEVQTGGGGGGGGGTSNYNELSNRPQINSTTLTGNKASSDLGLQSIIDSSHKLSADLVDDTSATNKFNVQADWNQTTDTASDYIKNKPTIPAAQVNSDWNASSGVSQILNKPTLGTAAAAATTDFATSAQGTKADSAVQSVKVNGSALTPDASKAVDITAIPASIVSAGALASGMTATTQSTSDDSTKLATTAFVHDVVDALPEPMVFKGSLGAGGTITTLPTASSSNKGYVYKVITAGTYASQSAKVGDTFISDGSAWVLIPSGDEPSGTVTNVAVANGGGLTVSGSPITSSGTITVAHSNSVTAKTSSSVKKFTYDAHGHVTGSSELSTAESDALASGIDSTKVEQIETNKNNILLVEQNIRKNIATINNGTNTVVLQIPVSAVANKSYQISIASLTSDETLAEQGCRIALMNNDDVASNVIYMARGNNKTGVLTTTGAANSLWIYASGAYQTSVGKSVTVANLMLCDKALYDAGYTDYQPYIPTVEDIMAMINQ